MAAPTQINVTPGPATVNENAANNTVIGTLSAVDTDPTTYTWSLVNNAGGRFGISGSNLIVANGSLLDFEQQSVYTVTVRVTESGVTFDQQISISLNDITAETITGSSGSDTLTAAAGNDSFNGSAGNDSMSSGDGNDILDGGTGADSMSGGTGNDTFYVDNALDQATDEAFFGGTDTVISAITYTLASYIENLTLTGTAVNATGNSANNLINGTSIANVIDGKGGSDSMIGGLGDDTYYVDNVNDVVQEAVTAGSDLVISSVSYSLSVSGATPAREVENLTLTGTLSIGATGNALANVLTGNDAANVLDGKGGNDTMAGGLGNDTYYVDVLTDVVSETTADTVGTSIVEGGIDTVVAGITYSLTGAANVEKLTLTGTAAINAAGNTLANTITGNDGANLIDGGTGNDTMAGGLGDDTYVLDVATDKVTENLGEGTDTVRIGATYSIAVISNVERIELTGTGNIDATGNTLNNQLVGTTGANVLDGGAGDDTLTGSTGNDTYVVDSSADVVTETSALAGEIDLVQSTASFTLGANVENLTLIGAGFVNATGNTLNNVLTGNGSANILNGGTGNDTMSGGGGDDTYYVDSLSDSISEVDGQGLDTVVVSFSYTLATTAIENLTLSGTAANATGNALANILTGNASNNLFDGGAGADTMAGGGGNDTYYVDDSGDVVSEASTGGAADVVMSSVSYSLVPSTGQPLRYVETLTLTGTANTNATGNGLANTINGNSGNNSLNGGAGSDTLIGGAGDDTYTVDVVTDVVTELAAGGNDRISFGGALNADISALANIESAKLAGTGTTMTGNATGNVLIGNSLANSIDGGAGADSMTGGAGNDTYTVDNAGDIITELNGGGTDSVNSSVTFTLGSYVDNLTLTGTNAVNGAGNSSNNVLTGNGAANNLNGKIGADTMTGGGGDDTYTVDNVGDVVDESTGTGTDLVYSSISYTLTTNVEKLTLSGSTLINATGNSAANTLVGNAAANVLDGSTGNDTMSGGLGSDTYVVDAAGDVVTEGSATGGTDTVLSAVSYTLGNYVENLTLTGSTANSATGNSFDNILTGNSGNNSINGGVGNDTMYGGAGNDTLNGSDGNDVYVFDSALNATTNVDSLGFFDVATDTIYLSQSVFTGLSSAGALASAAFHVGTAASGLSDRIIYNSATGDLMYDADGSASGSSAIKFATLAAGLTTLSAADFYVI